MKKSILGCAIILSIFLLKQQQVNSQEVKMEESIKFSCPIPNHCTLELSPKKSWTAEIQRPDDNMPPTIVINNGSVRSFEVLITVGWAELARPGFDKPKELYSHMVEIKDKVTPQAKEKNIVLEKLAGTTGTGYYFSATDKKPKPGEFKCMTQSQLPVGNLLLVFTIFHNEMNSTVKNEILDMLANSKCSETEKATESSKTPEKICESIADEWLKVMDSGGYSQCYERMSETFKKNIDNKTGPLGFKAMRDKLGKVITRTLVGSKSIKSLQGYPDREGCIVKYQVVFEKKNDAIEAVGFIKDKDGAWRVNGYITNQ